MPITCSLAVAVGAEPPDQEGRVRAAAPGLVRGMAERTPNTRASYDAVATTPRWPTPPTTTGFPRSDGLSRCSTAAKNASRSRCRIDGSARTGSFSQDLPHAATSLDSQA